MFMIEKEFGGTDAGKPLGLKILLGARLKGLHPEDQGHPERQAQSAGRMEYIYQYTIIYDYNINII